MSTPNEASFKKPIEVSLKEYFERRGYSVPVRIPNLIWRWFFVSFTQPPFAGFWRVWNPYLGFPLYQLYRKLGGNRNRVAACLLTFAACGFGHDILLMITREPHDLGIKRTIQFLIFGVLVTLTSPLRVQRWFLKLHPAANVAVNLAFIGIGMKVGNLLWTALKSGIWSW